MITHRRINVERDRDVLLDFHAQANYAVASPWIKSYTPFEEFRAHWLATPQPQQFIEAMIESQNDVRTVAEVWEIDGEPAGYIWVRFTDIPEYGFTRADVDDLAVAPQFRRRGLGSKMMEFAEEAARASGANALYVDTGWENAPARSLYVRRGFREREIRYEMLLRVPGG